MRNIFLIMLATLIIQSSPAYAVDKSLVQNIAKHVRQHADSSPSGKRYVLDYTVPLSSQKNDYCLITLYDWNPRKLDHVLRPMIEFRCPTHNLYLLDYDLTGIVSFGTTMDCQKVWRTWTLRENPSDVCTYRYSKWWIPLRHNHLLWQKVYDDFIEGLASLLQIQ